jgi:hypothetical protein
LAIAGRAEAQERVSPGVQSEPTPADQIITTLPNESVGSQGYPRPVQAYKQYELEEANRGIRNTRNALIATSALAGVGMIVGATAFRHCEFIGYSNVNRPDDLVCTQRDDALFVAGGTIFGLAAIGMITSGIMLGVRKGKRRRLRREIRSQQGASFSGTSSRPAWSSDLPYSPLPRTSTTTPRWSTSSRPAKASASCPKFTSPKAKGQGASFRSSPNGRSPPHQFTWCT